MCTKTRKVRAVLRGFGRVSGRFARIFGAVGRGGRRFRAGREIPSGVGWYGFCVGGWARGKNFLTRISLIHTDFH